MQLPAVENPERYQDLYVFDFGAWTALGYTAEEVAMLLETETYRDGKVYRIVRAGPEGGLELQGVDRSTFERESGMFFYRAQRDDARRDFDQLRALAQAGDCPCRAFVHLADRGDHPGTPRYVTALIYPGEFEAAMGQWLLRHEYPGGDTVEGGPSHVSNYYEDDHTILEREQLWSGRTVPSRSLEEVLASVKVAVQR
jgi:hypothetical protein